MRRSFLHYCVVFCIVVVAGCDPCMNNPCDDGLACNGLETCTADGGQAVCMDGTQVFCAFPTFCTEPDGVCVSDGPGLCAGNPCDDGLACNGIEVCTSNGFEAVCSDGIPITCGQGEVCQEPSGTCPDPCSGILCDDGSFCNGIETRVGCECRSGSPPCAAGETCDEATDSCGAPKPEVVVGSIVAWGSNSSGQTDVPSPNTGFVAVAAGWAHSVGLKADGSIVAWGYNAWGQSSLPSPNTDFVAVAAAHSFSVGLKGDGSIVAWGFNGGGQLNVPAPNVDFVAISAGGHTLGLKTNGSIVAWGCDDPDWDFGQCNVPAPNADFVAVAAGGQYSVGLKNDGSIVVWGSDSGADLTSGPSPNTGFQKVAASEYGAPIGLRSDGSLAAWGTGLSWHTDLPSSNTRFVAIAAGQGWDVGLKEDGSIVTWGGINDDGQLNVPSPNTGFVAVSAGGFHGLGLKGRPTVVCDHDCDDGDLCTSDSCNVDTGACVFDPVVCPAGFVCDAPTGNCVQMLPCTDDTGCDDGVFCNGVETCDLTDPDNRVCTAGTSPCTADQTCDEDLNACSGAECTGDGACRELPTCYNPGVAFTVSIEITAPSNVAAAVPFDSPPDGWTVDTGSISDNGSWDSNFEKVKWAFTDNLSRTVTYSVTPATGSSGAQCFDGAVAFTSSDPEQGTGGDLCVSRCSTD